MNGSMLERDGDDDVALCASVVATSDDVEALSDDEELVVDRPFVPPDFEHLVDSTHVLEGGVGGHSCCVTETF